MNLIPQNIKSEVLEKLNSTVSAVISTANLNGFERAYMVATAVADLKAALTNDYMQPIMALQGNRLGFKTDKDKEGGYGMDVVRNCLIEAVLTGVQPFGNQFNIIAGNCYITKEGCGHLLTKFPGLESEIIPRLPRIDPTKGSAAIVMEIKWTVNGKTESREIDFAIRVNSGMGADAVIGKATRKARAWLISKLTGIEIGEGDVQDVDSSVVSSKMNESIPTQEELKALLEEKRPLLPGEELAGITRIIENNETNSFAKAKSTLLKYA